MEHPDTVNSSQKRWTVDSEPSRHTRSCRTPEGMEKETQERPMVRIFRRVKTRHPGQKRLPHPKLRLSTNQNRSKTSRNHASTPRVASLVVHLIVEEQIHPPVAGTSKATSSTPVRAHISPSDDKTVHAWGAHERGGDQSFAGLTRREAMHSMGVVTQDPAFSCTPKRTPCCPCWLVGASPRERNLA